MNPSVIDIPNKLAGYYKLEAITLDDNGEEIGRRVLADWFPNLILDQGLDKFQVAGCTQYCQVGSGNTAPTVADTALQSFVASSQTVQALVNGNLNVSPYYCWFRKTYRFATGVAAGNLAEIGVGDGASGSTLMSRALILDGSGTPTTITVLPTEVLDATYELRLYPPLTDITGNITISGTNYSYTLRACNVTTDGNPFSSTPGWGLSSQVSYGVNVSGFHSCRVYAGSLGAVTNSPNGDTIASANGGGSTQAYVSGTYYVDIDCFWGLDSGNAVGGFKSLRYSFTRSTYQIEFSPNIPKDNTKVLSIRFRESWSRATIP